MRMRRIAFRCASPNRLPRRPHSPSGIAAIQRVGDRLRRHRRMQIDWDVERFGALQDRPEEFVVQIAAVGVPIARYRRRPSSNILKLLENLFTAGAPTPQLFNETPAWPG